MSTLSFPRTSTPFSVNYPNAFPSTFSQKTFSFTNLRIDARKTRQVHGVCSFSPNVPTASESLAYICCMASLSLSRWLWPSIFAFLSFHPLFWNKTPVTANSPPQWWMARFRHMDEYNSQGESRSKQNSCQRKIYFVEK